MFKNPFSFSGRIRRTELGVSYVIIFGCIMGLAFIDDMLGVSGGHILVQLIAIFWVLLSQGAKRCHDLGKSGFYQLIPFYVFVMLFREGQKKRNRYGQDPVLVENLEREFPLPSNNNGFSFPNLKQKEDIVSELISGTLLTLLAVAVLNYYFYLEEFLYFITASILVVMGYYVILSIGYRRVAIFNLTKYFLLHRLIFSTLLYLCIIVYSVYSDNLSFIDFWNTEGDFGYVFSIFILSYIPYLIFKSRKSIKPVCLEA